MPAKKFNCHNSERIHYFRGLRILVDGTKQVENEKLNQELDTDAFRSRWNSMIWLELQAWQKGNSIPEHDRWLIETRLNKIPTVINQVIDFCFDSDHEKIPCTDEVSLLLVNNIENPTQPKHILNNSLSFLSKCYFDEYFVAFKQVENLMKNVTYIEQLFSSRKNLFNDFPICADNSFQDKVELLCTWYNTSFELLHNFSSIMDMLGFEDYKFLILSLTRSPDSYMNDKGYEPDLQRETDTSDSNTRFSDAITKMTESYLRKHKVQNILSLLLNKHIGCLVRAHNMLSNECDLTKHTNEEVECENRNMIKLLDIIKKSLPNIQCNVAFIKSKWYKCWCGLPDIKPLYDFVQSFIFTIMDECLTLRLNQAQECRKQCGSTTSLLTVQQIVTECKEVIQCSLLTLRVHFALHLPDCLCIKTNPHCKLKMEFESNLMRMFNTYLDFVKLSVTALLTGLPHAPRNFVDTLHSELQFAKNTAAELDISSCIPSSCKFIDICEQMFLTTEDFLETASGAIFLSKTTLEDLEPDCLPEEVLLHKSSFFWQPIPRTTSPTSPQAGVLWFHRQRSESPHFARHHSISFNKPSNPHPLHFTKSAPALLVNSESESHRRYLFELCRAVRDLFEEVRERAVHSIAFGKSLRKSMESAIQFRFVENFVLSKKHSKKGWCRNCSFLQIAKESGFVKINIEVDDQRKLSQEFDLSTHMIFFIENLIRTKLEIPSNNYTNSQLQFKKILIQTLTSYCTLLPMDSLYNLPNAVFLFVKLPETCSSNSVVKQSLNFKKHHNHQCFGWSGPVVCLDQADLESSNSMLSHALSSNLSLTSDMVAITENGSDIGRKRKELLTIFQGFIQITVAQSSVIGEVSKSFSQLHTALLSFSKILVYHINTMARHLQRQVFHDKSYEIEDVEQLYTEINRVVQKNFNIGFEYLTEAMKLLSGSTRHHLEEIQLNCLVLWMQYVIDWLPRGKGFRPRWASIGINFLANLNLDLIKTLNDDEYIKLKELINKFIDHLVGNKPTNNESLPVPAAETPVYRSLSSNSSKDGKTPLQDRENDIVYFEACDHLNNHSYELNPLKQIQKSIREKEESIDYMRMEAGMIGRVIDSPSNSPFVQLTIRSVSFQWQRGHKIGEGSFGRVYTCVNMNTGNILAMKEVSFQPHDERHIKQALDEITNFEGVSHQNLVKYYGVELHRDQMFIFMDYCDAGTLEEVSRIGLPEVMIQQYTAQLATAVSVLHDQGFVHRDIKGSNIFLTSHGLLKLGDFGSAVRLLNRSKTLAGELASHHGITAAYSAPEVINSVENRGYGRAADIWSIGCVVIEMATGKRPWHDHEPFQIFYKVGMGSKPSIPNNLSYEGRNFIERCLEIDPNKRWNIHSLQDHPFVKVSLQVDT